MSRRGEQGEHFATSSVLSSRVLGRDRETASLLPLLTPGSTDPRDAGSARPAPRPVNPVILALVVALRDVEQRRGRGKVLTHLTSKRPAA